MTARSLLFHPAGFFEACYHRGECVNALLFLILVACLAALIAAFGKRASFEPGKDTVRGRAESLLLAFCMVFLAGGLITFADFAIARLFRVGAQFDWLISLTVFGSLPMCVVWIALPVWSDGWWMRQLMKAACIAATV